MTPEKPAKTYEDLINAIVAGQIVSFLKDHPEIAEHLPKGWRAATLRNSLHKRIAGDLTAKRTKVILQQALAQADV